MPRADPLPHPLDEHRDPREVALVRTLAAGVAARYGGDLTRMRRANGYSNATWVGDGIAVRIALTPVDMTREVELVRALPRGVGHPTILGAGTAEGHGWVVTAEVPGENLQDAWPMLTPADHGRAVRELWARVQLVHDASAVLQDLVPSHGGFLPRSPDEAMAAGRADLIDVLPDAWRTRLREVVEGYFLAAPTVQHVVNHGDLALMNALWDGTIVALLDVEFAVLAPIEIDLCRLVYESCVSEGDEYLVTEAGAAALEIAADRMDPRHGRALIHGAAVLDQLRDLDVGLELGTAEGIEESRPYRMLADLLDDGGYLAPLLGRRAG